MFIDSLIKNSLEFKIIRRYATTVHKHDALSIVKSLFENDSNFSSIKDVHLAGSLSRKNTGNDLDLLVTIEESDAEKMTELAWKFVDAIKNKLENIAIDLMIRRNPSWDEYFANMFSPQLGKANEGITLKDFNPKKQKEILKSIKKVNYYVLKAHSDGGWNWGYILKPIYSIDIHNEQKHNTKLSEETQDILDKMFLGLKLITQTHTYKSTGTTNYASLEREFKEPLKINHKHVRQLEEAGLIKKTKEEKDKHNMHITTTYYEIVETKN